MSARYIFLLLICVILVIFFLVFINPDFESIKRLIELGPVVGRLEVSGNNPEIIAVYLENNLCDELGGVNKPEVNIALDSERPIIFNTTVYDVNGDCNGGVTFYICANETAVSPIYCDENYDVYTVSVPTPNYQYGGSQNNLFCNYSTVYNLPYFRRCGNWYVNVTASDIEGRSNSTVRWWKDNLFAAVYYPYNGTIGDLIYMGKVTLGQWNEGKGQNTTKNTGNINITSLIWNATNFTRTNPPPTGIIPIISFAGNTTVAIDDDINRNNGAGYINETPAKQIEFPSYGLYRCENAACNTPRANYDFWWHIYVPSESVPSGTYENMIEYNYSTSMRCD